MPSPKTIKPEPRAAHDASGHHDRDDFLGGRITVLQPQEGHRSGSDAVWLQAAVPAKTGEHVLDAGAGVGVAGLCLLARVPGKVTAVEIDSGLCALAEANAARNGFAARFSVNRGRCDGPPPNAHAPKASSRKATIRSWPTRPYHRRHRAARARRGRPPPM